MSELANGLIVQKKDDRNSLNVNEKMHLFGCPDFVSLTEKLLMARIFFRIFTENDPALGTGKNIIFLT